MQTAGISMGSANIRITHIDNNNQINNYKKTHEGDVKKTLIKLINDNNLDNFQYYAVTGKKFKSMVNLPSIAEAEAVEIAYDFVSGKYPEVEAIVSAGAETFLVYELNQKGKIMNVYTGNKCASGTGEFFIQQITRMDLRLDQAMEKAIIEDPYRVSGRCSVFCKSDCTHALNKGEEKGKIVAGLCKMMADKLCELVNRCKAKNIMLIGGTANNKVMVKYLKNRLNKIIVPEEAGYFESIGTAVWAKDNGQQLNIKELIDEKQKTFEKLPPLYDYRDKVKYHHLTKEKSKNGDRCILGLDVGSTTTKAVLIREEDNVLLDSVYLRTNGDPVQASRNCYQQLYNRQKEKNLKIIGLGVTGSGRRIAGLHALTDSIINEIIAHATAAVYFDSEVDTIFEIGGQDAKYTYIVNKVPTDYAMNEACSAGTGSFLEESAKESLNIEMEDIADVAIQGNNPPNFSDQCAAFISSDIKNAIQEGHNIKDICAGLVYSICMNYKNRVKGSRPVGDKIFMQGGVCYNRAVPLAMAALTEKEIVVPPEPGLMGAFGVALVVKENLQLNLVEERNFELKELADRDIKRINSFTCSGGREECDRKCKINVLQIKGEKYPFGGICDKYINLNRDIDYDLDKLNLVKYRQDLLYKEYYARPEGPKRGKIGINRSLTVNQLLPLYSKFFAELGFEVVLPEEITEEGVQEISAAFCYPVEISHGYMNDLLQKETDFIFIPHIKGLYVENSPETGILCPMAQSEPYYLQATWEKLSNENAIIPVLDFKDGYQNTLDKFIEIGKKLGCDKKNSRQAFQKAVKSQKSFENKLLKRGKKVLDYLKENPEEKAIVAFGRPYNAFAAEANMGIPHKFASRGELIIPFDMLPLKKEVINEKMYWSMGQMIMKAASYVSNHSQLFGLFITNFSCGPDSFLVKYFRREHGRKPSLTLELDSHTADAGLNTRIEAFLDVVESYRELINKGIRISKKSDFKPAHIEGKGSDLKIYDSQGKSYVITDKKIQILIPSMSRNLTRSMVSTLEYAGINAKECPSPGETELKLGRANASGKECLPLLLTLGSLLNYIEKEKDEDELLVYFMPEATGPCRFGQYNVLIRNLIKDKEIENVAVLSLTSTNCYAGFGLKFRVRAWQSLVIADVLNEIHSAVLALSTNKEKALEIFKESREKIFNSLAKNKWSTVKKVLTSEAEKLSKISLKQSYSSAKKVALTGEVYVRNDKFSRQYLVERLAEKNIITRVSSFHEWIYYIDYVLQNKLVTPQPTLFKILKNRLEHNFKKRIEKTVKSILAETNLYQYKLIDIEEIIKAADDLISDELTGETMLTIGAAISEIIDDVDGVIAIGPFGCMPNRVAESIITDKLDDQKIKNTNKPKLTANLMKQFSSLPFLAIESDGNSFPQVIEARLETFCLQVERINKFKNSIKDKNKHIYAEGK